MEYVIPVLLALLIAAGGAWALMSNARKKTTREADGPHDRFAADSEHSTGPGIGEDPTPLADTDQHAGVNTPDGRTVSEQDADRYGGTGRPLDHYGATVPPEREAEAEAEQRGRESAAAGADPGATKPPPPPSTPAHPRSDATPDSETLADRPA